MVSSPRISIGPGFLGLKSGFTPRISIGPAGCRINRDYDTRSSLSVMEIVPNKALSLSLSLFGLWRVCFPPVLIRPDRRLLV